MKRKEALKKGICILTMGAIMLSGAAGCGSENADSQPDGAVGAQETAEITIFKANNPSTTIYLWLISLTASKELSILLLKLYNDGAIGISFFFPGLRVRSID